MKSLRVLDLHFLDHQQTIASFLIETTAGPVLVETGPHSTFPALEKALAAAGYTPDQVRHVLLTHIHFDHAGAAWALAERGATVYVHPAGERHLHAPERLYESARRIYGDDMERLWGAMNGIPTERLRTVGHGETLAFGDTTIIAHHTPGHAVHHVAWQLNDTLFAGDVAGVRIDGGPVVPPCPPPDIHVEDWQASLNLLRGLSLRSIYLTHFGEIVHPAPHFDELEERLLSWAEWMRPRFENGDDPQAITPEFQTYVKQQLTAHGVGEEGYVQYETANPSWMSVAGLLRYWKIKSR